MKIVSKKASRNEGQMSDLTQAGWNESLDKLAESLRQSKGKIIMMRTNPIPKLGKQTAEQNTSMNKNTLKSIGAVFAGFIAVLCLSIGTDVLLGKLGVFPPQNEPDSFVWWMLMLIYRSIYAVVGGYVTATLAPSRPMRHVIILGIIGLIFAILGSIVNWNKTTASTAWYPILFIILTLPSVWLGGKLKTK